MNTNSDEKTVSEQLFESLCAKRNVGCVPIPREGDRKKRTADYSLSLGSMTIIAEVKQLDPNEHDKLIRKRLDVSGESGSVVSPSNRVRTLIVNGYKQVKNSSQGTLPTMIVLYNNSGWSNWIDNFTVSKAMFGSFGFVLGLRQDNTISVAGHGYLGERAVSKNSLRSLSVVAALSHNGADGFTLKCYHNPYATIPVDPTQLAGFADKQYIHPDPHARGFIPWEPDQIQVS